MKISCSLIFRNVNPGTVGQARRTHDRRFGRSRRFKNRHEEQERHEDIGRDEQDLETFQIVKGKWKIEIEPHAKPPRRKEPISTDYADFRRLGRTPKYILTRLTGLSGFNSGYRT
jgi:hypothetical protein